VTFDLAFEGGGAKGAVFIGAMAELETRGHSPRRLVGTSAGALVAAMVAAGYNARELGDALGERMHDGTSRMSTFLDVPDGFSEEDLDRSALQRLFDRVDLPLVSESMERRLERGLLHGFLGIGAFRMIFSLLERGGVFAGDNLHAWTCERLDHRHPGLSRAGFAEMAKTVGRDLSITVSDTTGEEMLVLNARTAPDFPVAWAVRASMSVPLVFQEVVWDRRWGTYRGRDMTGHTLIDGGVLSNFPFYLLTSDLAEIREIMGPADPAGAPNLGLLIDERLPVPGQPSVGTSAIDRVFELPALRRMTRLMETMLNAHDRAVIQASMANGEICRLPAQGYGSLEFGMTEARRAALIEAGRAATAAYLDRRMSALA
jgi:predicted acylesterase/phospholipase RssA